MNYISAFVIVCSSYKWFNNMLYRISCQGYHQILSVQCPSIPCADISTVIYFPRQNISTSAVLLLAYKDNGIYKQDYYVLIEYYIYMNI